MQIEIYASYRRKVPESFDQATRTDKYLSLRHRGTIPRGYDIFRTVYAGHENESGAAG